MIMMIVVMMLLLLMMTMTMMMMTWSYGFYDSGNEMSMGAVESFLHIFISF